MSRRAYQLLLAAMEDQQRVGIGTVVMRTKQYLAAIRPYGKLLVLETMFYPDEIRPTSDMKASDTKISDREIQMATQLVDGLSTEWDPKRYRDKYRERVLNLIKRKQQGKEIVAEAEETPEVPSDLMSALQASYEAMQSQRKGGKRKAHAKRASSGRKSAGRTRKRSA